MNELSLDKLENLQGGKFWGNEDSCVYGTCSRTCFTSTYRFWFRVKTVVKSFDYTC